MDDDYEEGILTEEQGMMVLVHQARCSKLPEEKREFRRNVLMLITRPECRAELLNMLDDLGLADCYGKEARFCLSSG